MATNLHFSVAISNCNYSIIPKLHQSSLRLIPVCCELFTVVTFSRHRVISHMSAEIWIQGYVIFELKHLLCFDAKI